MSLRFLGRADVFAPRGRECILCSDVVEVDGVNAMLPISRRYSHFVFGVIQSGLTSALAAGIASAGYVESGSFLQHWLGVVDILGSSASVGSVRRPANSLDRVGAHKTRCIHN